MNRKSPLHPLLEEVVEKYEREITPDWRRDLKSGALGLSGEELSPSGVGILTIVTSKAATGEIVQVESGKNLVVNKGRQALAHLLGGAGAGVYNVTNMTFGPNNNPPLLTDNAIGPQPAIITKSCVPATYPDILGLDLKVRFVATVGALEGNGPGVQVYREAALLRADGNFFSHKVTGDITKDNSVVLTATWTIIF